MNNLKRVKINDTFWGRYEKLITDSVIPYQENALLDRIPDAEKSHAVENFRQAAQVLKSGSCNGEFYGMVFQDSDVAKWLEAASYSLLLKPDPALEKRMDELIDLIGQAQREDGYLNTYFTVKEPGREWTNLMEAHELYCAGHMIEAAVAYYECTGKRSLLDIMCKMADHIYNHFIIEKAPGYPGHPEIELALVRLYEVTHDERYFELAKHFIDVRGVDPDYFDKECKTKPFKVWGMDPFDKEYAQNNMPLRDLTQATGHAVRAVYLYSGMADVAAKTRDSALLSA
ncbi:MAG: glycoside hydrolase family 127 protein, partial [Clostridiales bacterium]|nr:glycoside hydrolase family 127 protein [Clostridiales bacterium]